MTDKAERDTSPHPAGTSGRVAYVNGEIVPADTATLSIRDTGFVYGDGVFDTIRTFDGRLFRLGEHVDRLFESLHYVRIDPGMTRQEIIAATERVVDINREHLRDGEDYWVTIRVTSGLQVLDGEPPTNSGATVVVECVPLPLRARAEFFRSGIPAIVPHRRRIPPEAISPNAKTNNYLNMMLAQREVAALQPAAWALMCDINGNVAEGPGCNFFIIRNGEVLTPTTEFVLAGVSRAVVIELCEQLAIPLRETTVTLQSALTADEAFFTSTSLCACPVSSLNTIDYPRPLPGPITKRIMDAFAEHVDFDYVGQYLRFAGQATTSSGI